MQLDDYTSDGKVRRWEFVHGEPRCVSDALAPTDVYAPIALGRNALISRLLALVAAYETAARVEEPPLDAPNYEIHLAAYHAAREIVEGAGTAVQALARIRAGAPDEGDEAVLIAIVGTAPPIAPVVLDTGISWLEFLTLFTQQEVGAIVLSVNPSVAVFRFMASGLGGDMHLDDPRVGQGLDALIAAGLINAERKAKVLARIAP